MKSDPFDVIAKYQNPTAHRKVVREPTADLTEGPIIAVEICSNVLEAHIWLALDDSFEPKDGEAIFYADELPFLATKDADQLREIHKGKLAFPGSRVRQ
jgi:hypothetical protein